MKLTKAQLKQQKEVLELLKKDKLTHDEKCRVYKELNEGYFGDVSTNSAYFTGLDLALDFALMSPTHGTLIDLCAGFGVLSFAAITRDTYEGDIKKIILIEREAKYIEIGKKLVESNANTEVVWVHGDMFDKELWEKIEAEHGKADCLLSNPPFGKVSKTDYSRDWLKYKGSDLDIASLEIGILKSEYPSYILPQGSCEFRYSGRPYFEHVENRKVLKLKKETGLEFYMACSSVDTKVYEQNFKNTHITVECLTLQDIVIPD